MELVEWFRWKTHRKHKTRYKETSSIPPIFNIRKRFMNGSQQFTKAQDTLRKQFPGLTGPNWQNKILEKQKNERRNNHLR